MASVTCPMGHVIKLIRQPVDGELDYLVASELPLLVDQLVAAADEAEESGESLDSAIGPELIDVLRSLLFCTVCGSLMMHEEDPPLFFVPSTAAS